MRKRNQEGFTLIEVLLVVALIAILAAVTIIAINPSKNFSDTRNTERKMESTEILNAVSQFISEEGNTIGDLDGGSGLPLCSVGTGDIGSGDIDLNGDLVPEYLVGIPEDPDGGTAADTGYDICEEDDGAATPAGIGRIRVVAPNAEGGETIEVIR